jgi:hypothetical protein
MEQLMNKVGERTLIFFHDIILDSVVMELFCVDAGGVGMFSSNWLQHKKHFIILSSAGKPIWSR